MPLTLHSGNRLELLADELATLTAADPMSPLAPETVIVQSRGMARWLALEMAGRQGVCANLQCPFPATFVWLGLGGDGSVAGVGGAACFCAA